MTLRHILPLTLAAGTLLLASCNGSKTMTPKQAGEVSIIEYCSDADYPSNKDFFRATATGESIGREAAKKMARTNAETKLARTIMATVEIVSDNYVRSAQFNNVEELTSTFNELARVIVKEQLSGTPNICSHLTMKPDGKYMSYIAIELSGAELVSKYNERLSEDERIRAEYNYERFKETFEAEMAKQR